MQVVSQNNLKVLEGISFSKALTRFLIKYVFCPNFCLDNGFIFK